MIRSGIPAIQKIPVPTKTIVVGLGYKARHGKDTAARMIIGNFGNPFMYDIRKYAFGDELKREVAELGERKLCLQYGIPYDENPDMSDPLCPNGKQSKLLQYYGTEVRRAEDHFYWVRKLAERIEQDQPRFAIISDVRFLNEIYFVRAARGFTVKVTRENFVDLSRSAGHRSESELDSYHDWDYEISAKDGERHTLEQDAFDVFNMILQRLTPVLPGEDDFKLAA